MEEKRLEGRKYEKENRKKSRGTVVEKKGTACCSMPKLYLVIDRLQVKNFSPSTMP